MQRLIAVETKSGVATAVRDWIAAFKTAGEKISSGKKPVWWIERAGIWVKSTGTIGPKNVYWNGLGVELTPDSLKKGIVQVNPPVSGSSPFENQGVVAKDQKGLVWILHFGRLNVENKPVILHDYPKPMADAGIEPVEVVFKDGSVRTCVPVAAIGFPDEIIALSKRFVDLCLVVRTANTDGQMAADFQRKALDFEEPSGDYVIPARGPIRAKRIHHDVCEALKLELKTRGFKYTNEKFGQMAPDLFTLRTADTLLFEIKTDSAADDILKAVGQLFVYEKLMGKACRRIMILPKGIKKANRKTICSLDIEIIDYVRVGKIIKFSWPKGFFESIHKTDA